MVIYADITTSPGDLRAAADAHGMTPTQFVAWATNNAVKAWKQKAQHTEHPHDDLGVVPGGD